MCAIASVTLVVLVGLQAPAASTGFRWTPGPRVLTSRLPPFDPGGRIPISFSLRAGDGWPAWLTVLLIVMAVIALLFALARLIHRVTQRVPAAHVAGTGGDTGVPSEAAARIVQSGLVAAIEILSTERDLGNAVVQAWQGLQDAAATAGVHRRPAETTTEFTVRLLYRSQRSAEPINALLSLYQRVRFGEYEPSVHDIRVARESLALLIELWRADFPERRKSKAVRV